MNGEAVVGSEREILAGLLRRRDRLKMNVGALDFLIEFYTKQEAAGSCTLLSFNDVYKNSELKSEKYVKLRKLSFDISKKTMAQELSFLLEYADSIRNVQMTVTYISLVKYIVTRTNNELDTGLKAVLAKHVRNAYLVSRDLEIIELASSYCPSMLELVSLPLKVLRGANGFGVDKFSKKVNANNMVFDNYDNDGWLNYFDVSSFENWQQSVGLSINKATLRDASDYVSKFNVLLDRFRLSHLKDAKFSTNTLSSFEFDAPTPKEGELVSIIVSCFNSESTIGYALSSLLKQSYKNIEILVCDDSSTDNSLSVITDLAKVDCRIRVFKSKSNQGTYNIRNSLIPLCNGKYITFQDSDDIAHPERIDKQVEHLEGADLLVTSCKWIRFDPEGRSVFFVDGQMIRFCVVSTMVDRKVFSMLPKFRESLVAADTEFHESCLCLLGGSRVGVLDVPLIFGLWGDGSLTKRPGLAAENTGFVAERRREYSEIAARQRVLGSELVPDEHVVSVLKEQGIYKEFSGVEELF